MTANSDLDSARATITIKEVLALSDRPDRDLSEVRIGQIRAADKHFALRIALQAAAVAAIAARFYTLAPLWMLGAWIGLCALALAYSVQGHLNRKVNGIPSATLPIVRKDMLVGLFGSVVAAGASGIAAVYGGPADMLYCAVVLSALMAGYIILMWATPLLVTSLVTVSAAAQCAGLIWHQQWIAAGAVVAGATALVISTIRAGMAHMSFRLVERAAEEKADTVSLLLREFEEGEADWLWQVDQQRRIFRPSPRLAFALGKEASEIEGQPLLQLLAGASWDTGRFPTGLHDLANKLNRRESFANLLVPVILGESLRWWELSASPRFDSQQRFLGFRGVGSDVTEQRESAEKIAKLARVDTLTGLPNRLSINEALDRALHDAAQWRRRCAFMMIDLDRFKAVNDTLGHPVGDRLLMKVSERLKQIMDSNTTCGRLGGDEFAVVVHELNSTEQIQALSRRIVENLSKPYEVDHHTLYVGASVGYAIGPRDGSTVEALTRNADLALYRSKEQGGSNFHAYEPQLHSMAQERREIEIELRSALKNNEMEVHYQPVVSADDGTIQGFEALLRWNSKKLGPVSPAKFIPVAEDTRLVGGIGEWVLQTACRHAVNWPNEIRVAVNVSPEQLTDPGFVKNVIAALSRSGLPAHRLELEVTESVFLRDAAHANSILEQLRRMGVRMSLDDFGTGYSSLAYLKVAQFDTIKIDRSFVQGAVKSERESIAIIRAVVALAESLGMATTAEGVETGEEVEVIRTLGCRKIQGYYYGRPMPYADASAIFGVRATSAA